MSGEAAARDWFRYNPEDEEATALITGLLVRGFLLREINGTLCLLSPDPAPMAKCEYVPLQSRLPVKFYLWGYSDYYGRSYFY